MSLLNEVQLQILNEELHTEVITHKIATAEDFDWCYCAIHQGLSSVN